MLKCWGRPAGGGKRMKLAEEVRLGNLPHKDKKRGKFYLTYPFFSNI
ncbi:hypothetical protein KAS10_03305 [Candidatus Aerophobetes bacterium]|nr:hypothetical protein [Candidatus Aerophobetes bacterium]